MSFDRPRTGWPAGMFQDDSREVSRALAAMPDAMQHARDVSARIAMERAAVKAAPRRFSGEPPSAFAALDDAALRIEEGLECSAWAAIGGAR